jgi:hypothetical protein
MADRNEPTVVVLDAHGAKVGWRAFREGFVRRPRLSVRIIWRSYGGRGESERKIPGMTGERVVRETGWLNRAAPPRTEAARAPFSTWAIIRGFATGRT